LGRSGARRFHHSLGSFGGAICRDDSGDGLSDRFAVSGEIVGGTPDVQGIAEVLVELSEERMNHRRADAVDGTPSTSIGSERRQGPDSDTAVAACGGEQLAVGYFEHYRVNRVPGRTDSSREQDPTPTG